MTPTDLDRIGRTLYGSTYAPDLAAALGVSMRTVHRYIAGEREIPDDMKARLDGVASKRLREITKLVARAAKQSPAAQSALPQPT